MPIVTHGFTLVTPCGLREVLEAIADFGFTNNPYPITLSLELHLCPEQMALLRRALIDVFGRQRPTVVILAVAIPSHGG